MMWLYTFAFAVNVRDAGEGTLEISICGPSGQNISNSVTTLGPGHFLVSYIPLEPGPHRANVTFNGESVCGTGRLFSVYEHATSKVMRRLRLRFDFDSTAV